MNSSLKNYLVLEAFYVFSKLACRQFSFIIKSVNKKRKLIETNIQSYDLPQNINFSFCVQHINTILITNPCKVLTICLKIITRATTVLALAYRTLSFFVYY